MMNASLEVYNGLNKQHPVLVLNDSDVDLPVIYVGQEARCGVIYSHLFLISHLFSFLIYFSFLLLL